MPGGSYSFQDVYGSIDGPGGAFAFEGEADEGIDIDYSENKNTMVSGASGDVMHSLHAANTGTVTVRTLKTSVLNGKMQRLYSFQTGSSANHGQNTILVQDPVRGDSYTCTIAAFQKFPNNKFAKDGNIMEWVFDVGKIVPVLANK